MHRIRALFCVAIALLMPVTRTAAADKQEPPLDLHASYSSIVKQVAPCVVTIATRTTISRRSQLRQLPDIPGLREFFGLPGPDLPGGDSPLLQEGLGSGVIVSADGYVLTNYHVIEGVDSVKVTLSNSYDEFTARVIGKDEKGDLAVLKIERGDVKLHPIPFADSAKVEVGDTVLAVGNPLGVGQTVTMGIISAISRGVGLIDYEDFLQTDAAINPGNSGGALVDVQGRLVGINTAILSRTGGNMGIGFAVPANLARNALDQIITKGKVIRGYIGVMIQPVTPELAKAMKLPRHEGALVGDVIADSPAAKAGITAGDVIVSYGDASISDPRNLRLRVAQTPPGQSVPLMIRRGGEEKKLNVVVQDQTEDVETAETTGSRHGRRDLKDTIGVVLQELGPDMRQRLKVPSRITGGLVVEIDPDSRAERGGLKPGDIVHEVDGKQMADAQAVAKALRGRNDGVLLRAWSGGGSHFIAIPPVEEQGNSPK